MEARPRGEDKLLERNARFKRVAWFVGLWLAGVMSLAVVAFVIRWAIRP